MSSGVSTFSRWTAAIWGSLIAAVFSQTVPVPGAFHVKGIIINSLCERFSLVIIPALFPPLLHRDEEWRTRNYLKARSDQTLR